MNMISFVFAVRDRQLDAFMRPFTAESVGTARRAFQDDANDKDSPVNKHPEDYELYQIGTYDANAGALQPSQKPVLIAIASELINRHDR